jgi:hypothetical protein
MHSLPYFAVVVGTILAISEVAHPHILAIRKGPRTRSRCCVETDDLILFTTSLATCLMLDKRVLVVDTEPPLKAIRG